MAISYLCAVARRSWERTVKDCVGRTAQGTIIRLAAFLLTLVFAYLYVAKVDRRSPAFDDATLAAIFAFGVFLAIFAGCLILNLLFVAPAILWSEQSEEICILQKKLTPTVSFEIENDGFAKEFPFGNVQQVASGDYVTNQLGNTRYICASIGNLSSVDTSAVLMTLIKLQRDGGNPLSDAVELRWHNQRYNGGYEFIPAGSPRTALLFRVTEARVYIASSEDLTIEQVRFIEGDAPYRGRLAITHSNDSSLLVDFVLKLSPVPQLTVVEWNEAL